MGTHKLSAVESAAVIMLFIAISAYAGAGFYKNLCPQRETLTVQAVCLKDSIELNGIAVRREQLVCSSGLFGDELMDGSRVSPGTPLGENSKGALNYCTESGIFQSCSDGFEYLRPEDFFSLSPSEFRSILNEKPKKAKNTTGRLIFGWDWYYAAICRENPELQLFSPCELCFKGIDYSVRGSIVSISPAQKGEVLIIIRLTEGGEEFLKLRKAAAELIFASCTGLEVPEKALLQDEEGNNFVYTLTAGKPKRQAVEIIYKSGERCIAAQTKDGTGLKSGDELIVSGKNKDEGRFYP